MDLGIVGGPLTQVTLSMLITTAVLLSVGISIGKFYTKQDLRQMPLKQDYHDAQSHAGLR